MEKVLSVSVAAYNVENCLEKCLESFIKSAVLQDIEILVIDDGSKDKTAEIALKYQRMYPNSIRLISKKNGGHGSTINKGILEASGKYFKIVDADDWVEIDGINNLVNYLKSSEADMVLNTFYKVNAFSLQKEIINPITSNGMDSHRIYEFDSVCSRFSLYMHAITFKTKVLKAMGPIIDENCFYVDTEYTVFPIKSVDNVVFLDFPVYDYLLGTATQSMNIANMIKRREQHLRVTKRLIDYYNHEFSSLSGEKQELIRRRVESVIRMQFSIYLSMEGASSYQEVIDFDRWLDENNPDLYKTALLVKGSGSAYIQFIKMEKTIDFLLYKPLLNILKQLRRGYKLLRK